MVYFFYPETKNLELEDGKSQTFLIAKDDLQN